jgi:hypothetical protein
MTDVVSWIAHHRLLSLASGILLIEIAFRSLAPKSGAYAQWTALFKAIGSVWTAVILSVVYLLSVGPVSIGMRLLGKDPLDRSLDHEPTFWRPHEPNPLGPEAAARHQF